MAKTNLFSEFPDPGTRLYFLGIGGVSMSSLALAAKKLGCLVSGYDLAKSETTKHLASQGIPVHHEFAEEHYHHVDLIVYTGAVHDTDPVLSYPRKLKIPEITRAAFMGLLMKKRRNPIGIAGTHGKSSTTGMLSLMFLAEENRDPTIMVGAHLPAIDSTYRLGDGEDFIFEACEYKDSFLDFFPRIAVVLNVEHDHADYFPTLEDVIASFVKFSDLAKDGVGVFNRDNEGAMRVAAKTESPKFFFSQTQKADLWCENKKENAGFYSFDIFTREGFFTHVSLAVPGEHNVENALAAASAAYLSGVSPMAVQKGLEAYRGVKRRFEYRGKCNRMPVFDDYAHHPDEIRATLSSAKKLGYEKITVVFQSHTYTRTKAYWNEFLSALAIADRVIFADVYPAREEPLPGITAENLAKDSENGEYLGSFEEIAQSLLKENGSGLLIVMGAGSIVSLTDRILTEKA